MTMHQSAFIRGLMALGHDVSIYVCKDRDLIRERMGWRTDWSGDMQITSIGKSQNYLASTPNETWHIFGGLGAHEEIQNVFNELRSKGYKNLAVLSEGGDVFPKIKLPLRIIKHWVLARKYSGSIRAFFAIGSTGERYWRLLGVQNIYPWLYLTDSQKTKSDYSPQGQIKFVFAGKLIKRKGIDLFLKALPDWKGVSVTIIGEGPQEKQLRRLAHRFKKTRVVFLPFIDNGEVLDIISRSDILFLPSRAEGWGAVVNEALLEGTRVLVSSKCGSSSLVNSTNGLVINFSHKRRVSKILMELILKGETSTKERNLISREAQSLLNPVKIADDFVQILNNSRN